jgi:hypothetical protein
MWRVIGCLAVLVVGLFVAASVITAAALVVGSYLGRMSGVSTWEAAALIVLVAGGLLWLVGRVVGPAWLPDIGLEEVDEEEVPPTHERPPPAAPQHPQRRRR